jgi:adenine-specific DNA methylase
LLLCPDVSVISSHPGLVKRLSELVPTPKGLAEKLTAFAGKLSWWDACTNSEIISLAQDLLAVGRERPPVVFDPFAGGGSIPVEALRLGLDAISGELNPVAHTALRVAIEHAPKLGPSLAAAYLKAARAVESKLNDRLMALYGGEGSAPLAYFWARTYKCPGCSVEVPLLRSRVLARVPRKVTFRLTVPSGGLGRFVVNVVENSTTKELAEANAGTVSAREARCPACGHKVTTTHLQSEGKAGQLGDHLFAVCETGPDGRRYRSATESDERHARSAQLADIPGRVLTSVPDLPFDRNGIRHIWAMQYGVDSTGDLYNHRQGIALLELFDAIRQAIDEVEADSSGSPLLKEAVGSLLSLTFNRVVMYSNRHTWWQATGEFPANIFVRQAISMVWDYVEIPINSQGAAGWTSAVKWMRKVVEHLAELPRAGQAFLTDAAHCQLPAGSVDVIATDPPYFDPITYAYLADVFYVWMKPLLERYFSADFAGDVGPKKEEAIVDRRHQEAQAPKTAKHFRKKMAEAFREAYRVLRQDGNLLIMYGHKKAAAWDAVLGPLVEAGFEPVVSWPVHTERKVKFKHGKIGALSSSCLILCRKRPVSGARQGATWLQFEEVLRSELGDLVHRYQAENTSGPDLQAALLAPAVALFSRYQVQSEDGRSMSIGDLFEKLPEITRACELHAALSTNGSRALLGIKDLISAVVDCGRRGGNWLSLSSEGPLLDAAIRHATLLAEGNPEAADCLVESLSDEERSGLDQLLRIAAVVSTPDSRAERFAQGSLGRLSMLARSWAQVEPSRQQLKLF